MALATRCPHCKTTFRVVSDQLKLRSGLVRCGRCRQIFNGEENLLLPDDVPPVLIAKEKATPDTSASFAIDAPSFDATPLALDILPSPAGEHDTRTKKAQEIRALPDESDLSTTKSPPASFTAAATPSPASTMPVSRLSFAIPPDFEREDISPTPNEASSDTAILLPPMTLVDIKHTSAKNAEVMNMVTQDEQVDELDKAIRELQHKPGRRRKRTGKKNTETTTKSKTNSHKPAQTNKTAKEKQSTAAPVHEPGFVRQYRARRKLDRNIHTVLVIACCVLSMTGILQAAYLFRNPLSAMFPQTRPALSTLCQTLDCRIELPTHIAAVSIESSELQAQEGEHNRFLLHVLLRNDSRLTQSWPQLELTLNDAAERPVLRRVFVPSEYLRDANLLPAGFAGKSEHSAQLAFELEKETRVFGYRAYLFYP